MNSFGLNDNAEKILLSIFTKYEQVNKVVLFGSRAKGNYTDRSDLDLIICNSIINRKILGKIIFDINNSNFPFCVDIQLLENIQNQNLIEHINRIGKTIFNKIN
jgi:predicted nucleotidyltransferase